MDAKEAAARLPQAASAIIGMQHVWKQLPGHRPLTCCATQRQQGTSVAFG